MFKKNVDIISSREAALMLDTDTWHVAKYVERGFLQAKYTNKNKSEFFTTGTHERLYFDKQDVLALKKKLDTEKEYREKNNYKTFCTKATVKVDQEVAEKFFDAFGNNGSQKMWQWAQSVIDEAIYNGSHEEWIYERT